jgi:diguanylate cyclase (GGDEF)-like protein
LNSPSLKSVLSTLIGLTNERDISALEISLAQALFDLIAPLNADAAKSITIYHIKDISKQLFSETVIGKKTKDHVLSLDMKQKLTNCFESGKTCSYEESSKHIVTLYPLNISTGHTMAILAIEADVCVPQQHETITMLLQIYQNFTGLIKDNERDTLTGLLNRKTFEVKIDKVLSKMHQATKRKDDKTGQLYFLAIFDIDHFKSVNDGFGHLIGDEVLLMLSQLMTQTFRDTDLIFRFGGEEFLGVFECSSSANIGQILERFRKKVSLFEFPQVGKVTVSSGYTMISADDGSSQIIDRADLALYYAKNNGRNRICQYEQLIADGSLQDNKKEGDIELF